MLRYTKRASVVFCEYLFLWVVYVFVTGHVKKKKKKYTLDPPLYVVKTSKNVWKRMTRYWNSISQLHFKQLGEARNGSLREKSFKIIATLYLNNFSLAWAYYIFSTRKIRCLFSDILLQNMITFYRHIHAFNIHM